MFKKLLLVSATGLVPVIGSAQVPSPQNPSYGGILQNQLERQLPELNPLPMPKAQEQIITPQKPAPTDVTILVKGFRFQGVTKVSEAELLAVLSPWINKTVNLSELNKAADAVSQFYQTKKLLGQASVPPQQIGADGIVLIRVIEAKLGAVNVEVEGESARFPKEKVAQYILYRNPVGEFVNTEKVEEAIYILNEVPGVAVATELQPGAKDGEVNLNVKVADTKMVTGAFTLSNYGSASTGELQGLLNLSINNPFGIGDQIGLNAFKTEGTSYSQASYSIPVHESGLRAGVNGSSMKYSTIGMFQGSKGDATTIGANLSYPLLRSQGANANLTFAFDSKSYQNNLTTGVVNSEYRVDVFNLGFSGNLYDSILGGGISTASLSASSGRFKNPLWNPSVSTNYGQYNGKQFNKLNIGLTRNQQLIPDQTILNVTFASQLASTNLDSVERFYLGGPNGVRAYPQSQGSGDQGLLLNVEVQQQLPYRVIGYAFYDLGVVRQYKSSQVYELMGAPTLNANNTYSLSGYGFGAKYNINNFNFNAFAAWPIGKNPLYRYSNGAYVPQNNDGLSNVPYIWLQGSYRF
jgi:hemolysin activation/secretion protein